MIMHPEVVLADEPTGNLDSKSGLEIMELLEGLNKKGVTLVMITHDQVLGNRAPRRIRIVDGHIE
jgi:putative ABC transport system ATP-binding protein